MTSKDRKNAKKQRREDRAQKKKHLTEQTSKKSSSGKKKAQDDSSTNKPPEKPELTLRTPPVISTGTATRPVTSTRLPADDRKALKDTNRAIYAALPEGKTPSKMEKINQIREFVAAGAGKEGLVKFMTPANAFIVMVYHTTSMRDKALKYFTNEPFRLNGKITPLRIEPFGADHQEDGHRRVWFMGLGFLDTAQDLERTILRRLLSKGAALHEIAKFEIRNVIASGFPTDRFAIVWYGKAPPWPGKQLLVNNASRLVTQEGKTACKLCQQKGHISLDCDAPNAPKLGQPYGSWDPEEPEQVNKVKTQLLALQWVEKQDSEGIFRWYHPDAAPDDEDEELPDVVNFNTDSESEEEPSPLNYNHTLRTNAQFEIIERGKIKYTGDQNLCDVPAEFTDAFQSLTVKHPAGEPENQAYTLNRIRQEIRTPTATKRRSPAPEESDGPRKKRKKSTGKSASTPMTQ